MNTKTIKTSYETGVALGQTMANLIDVGEKKLAFSLFCTYLKTQTYARKEAKLKRRIKKNNAKMAEVFVDTTVAILRSSLEDI